VESQVEKPNLFGLLSCWISERREDIAARKFLLRCEGIYAKTWVYTSYPFSEFICAPFGGIYIII